MVFLIGNVIARTVDTAGVNVIVPPPLGPPPPIQGVQFIKPESSPASYAAVLPPLGPPPASSFPAHHSTPPPQPAYNPGTSLGDAHSAQAHFVFVLMIHAGTDKPFSDAKYAQASPKQHAQSAPVMTQAQVSQIVLDDRAAEQQRKRDQQGACAATMLTAGNWSFTRGGRLC